MNELTTAKTKTLNCITKIILKEIFSLLQIIPAILNNGNKTIKTNTSSDSGSISN